MTTGSAKVTVADIDTGIDYTHPDLYRNVWINQGEIPKAVRGALADADADGLITFWDLNAPANAGKVRDSNGNGRIDARDVLAQWSNGVDEDKNSFTVGRKKYTFVDDLVGWNFVANTNNPWDDNGHGTHTAGTIAASANDGGVVGLNWQVQVMALKFLDGSGSGSFNDAAAAIRYAAFNKAKVSNNSWGGAGGYVGDAVYNAISYARSLGHLVVAAAGNSGVDNDTSASRSYPASYELDNIVPVAATDSSDVKASWSNYGAKGVDLAAPGVGILSTVPGGGYAAWSGTSMAAPHVTGAAARVWAANTGLSYADVKARLLNNVDKVGSLAGYTLTGGRLNVYDALTNAKVAPASTATTSTMGQSSTGSGTAGSLLSAKSSDDGSSDSEGGSASDLLNRVAAVARAHGRGLK